MQIHRDINNLPNFKNAVITIGSFDGVHIGHQRIIKHISNIAKKIDGESVLITFHPHPRTIVNANFTVKLLSPLSEKVSLLENTSLDHLVVVPFNRDFSDLSPKEYIHNFLHEKFKPSVIVIGYNHHFGKNRAGDISYLLNESEKLNFKVEQISKQEIEDISVSSSKIRMALEEGAIQTANTLLGRPYSIAGLVSKGEQLGRKIGFPTANLAIQNNSKLIPAQGVYAVKVNVENTIFNGMLNIGTRPTIEGKRQSIEVHIFDFYDDIYGKEITLELYYYLRSEKKFENLEALKAQLILDRNESLSKLENL